ncbi:hypothetical protein HK405_001777, partial [Cladochytrium tenue]
DIFTSQKFINARMTAQTGAIIGVGAIAALSATNSRDKMIDPYYERVVSGNLNSYDAFADTGDDNDLEVQGYI